DHVPAGRRPRRHLRRDLPGPHRRRGPQQREAGGEQVPRGPRGLVGRAVGDAHGARAVLRGPRARPAADPLPVARAQADACGPRRPDPSQARAGGEPPRLDRRQGHQPQGRRLRHRAVPRPRRDAGAGLGARPGPRGLHPRRSGRVRRPEPVPLPEGPRPHRGAAEGPAGRARPAHDLGRVRPRVRRRTRAGRPQHRRAAGRRAGPGAAGDADRHGPRRRAARSRGPHQRRGRQGLRLGHGAGRRPRHPDRPGAAGAVPRDPHQAAAARGGAGAEGRDQDPHPLDLLHPAVPLHRRPGPGRAQHARGVLRSTL
ncbi:MAG: Type II/IV secretion system protein TadC, associated with Flp pilus assembly, partial [uncultured Blastococcus sp.]